MKKLVYIVTIAAWGLTSQAATNQFTVTASSTINYTINGESDPDLTLIRGFTYTFNLNASGHPFWIKTLQSTGTGNAYNDGVTGNGTQVGIVTFTVPNDAPDQLYYNCQLHSSMTGDLNIIDPPTVEILDIVIGEEALLTYTGSDTLDMKVQASTNLSTGVWTDAEITFTQFVGGTYTSTVTIPAGDAVFFRVLQGYY